MTSLIGAIRILLPLLIITSPSADAFTSVISKIYGKVDLHPGSGTYPKPSPEPHGTCWMPEAKGVKRFCKPTRDCQSKLATSLTYSQCCYESFNDINTKGRTPMHGCFEPQAHRCYTPDTNARRCVQLPQALCSGEKSEAYFYDFPGCGNARHNCNKEHGY